MSHTDRTARERVDQVMELLQLAAEADYIGEDVSQLKHALQCAALAQHAKAPEQEILAALLHDIGHFCGDKDLPQMDGYGTAQHEDIGAAFLDALGFSEEVQKIVRGHVEAKRYLVGKHEHYAKQLSEASTQTLLRQGGPMSLEQQAVFERDPLFKAKLRLRRWDDGAKDVECDVPSLVSYRPMLLRHLLQQEPPTLSVSLTTQQKEDWQRQGYLHLTDVFTDEQLDDMLSWAQELVDWPETPGQWMKYFESTVSDQRQLCRVENFLPYHDGWTRLLCSEVILSLMSTLMGEEATLYKEKMNVKLPGGAGFGAHQDAPAFTTFGQTYHITLMLSIDASSPENGCLEMVPGRHKEGLFAQASDGTLHPDVIASMQWEPLSTNIGDIVLFDSYIPHRSQENVSDRSRRALYVTYNRAAEGSFREAYFAHKREHFPPECERVEGADYSKAEALYNLGNPIR